MTSLSASKPTPALFQKLYSIHRDVLLYCANLVLVLLAYLPYLRTMFAPDTYLYMEDYDLSGTSYLETIEVGLHLGRPMTYLWARFLYFFGIRVGSHQVPLKLLFCVALAGSLFLLVKLFLYLRPGTSLPHLAFVNLALSISVINIFTQEHIYFSDAASSFGFAYLFTAASVYALFRLPKAKGLLLSSLFLCISFGFYQVQASVYAIWGLIFLVANGKAYRQSFARLAIVGSFSLAENILLTLVFTNIGGGEMSSYGLSLSSILENTKALFMDTQPQVWGSQFLFLGKQLIPVCFLALSFLLVATLAKNCTAILHWCRLAGCVFAGYLSVFLMHVVRGTVWTPGRTLVGFYCLFSMVAIFIVLYSHSSWMEMLTMGVLGSFLLFNIYHINGFAIAQSTTNAIDHEISYSINDAISQYEEETGIEIVNIGFAEDTDKAWTYLSTFSYAGGDQNIRAWANEWARPAMFHYVTGRTFTIVPVDDEIYHTYFDGRNWKSLNTAEQLIFAENTVYVAVF